MSAISKRIVLITGGRGALPLSLKLSLTFYIANGGIGFELAAQLLAKKNPTYHVFIGARSSSKGTAALQTLQSRNLPGTAEALELDVTKDDTITRAAEHVEKTHGKLDTLVNNAGVAIVPGTLREQLRQAFDTNATGTAIMGETFLPLLKKGSDARVINVSSGAGSIERRLDPTSGLYKVHAHPYRASKAAMNMITANQFVEFSEFGIKVFAYCPGFTVSNLGPQNNAESGARSAEESVVSLVDVLEGKRDEDVGKFLHNTGVYPW